MALRNFSSLRQPIHTVAKVFPLIEKYQKELPLLGKRQLFLMFNNVFSALSVYIGTGSYGAPSGSGLFLRRHWGLLVPRRLRRCRRR